MFTVFDVCKSNTRSILWISSLHVKNTVVYLSSLNMVTIATANFVAHWNQNDAGITEVVEKIRASTQSVANI